MAIIIENSTTCSICENILRDRDEIIAWTAFLPREHKYWKYSDSGMHKLCFENWKYKIEFEELYKYQPMVDFNDSNLIKNIKEFGIPDWLKKIKEYRKGIGNTQRK